MNKSRMNKPGGACSSERESMMYKNVCTQEYVIIGECVIDCMPSV